MEVAANPLKLSDTPSTVRRPRTKAECWGPSSTGRSFFESLLLQRVRLTGLAPRPLQGKAELMEQPLTLPHTERDSIVFLKMVRQHQPIPQVLVVPQLSGRTPYFTSQPLLVGGRKPAWSPRPIAFLQPSQALGQETVNPVFHAPGRISVKACRFIGAGSVEDMKNNMEAMEISPLTGPRYLVLDGGDEGLCIGNRYPFHWEHPPYRFAPSIGQYSGMRNYLRRFI